MAEVGSQGSPAGRRAARLAPLVDAAFVVLFVVLGRKSHHEDGSFLAGTVRVALPFLIGAAVGWVASRAWLRPLDPVVGIQIWLATVVVGMVLRRFVFDQGTALPFIIVASVFTLVFLVGWRLVWQWYTARRAPRA
ncbi:MAG: hypothetical protein RLZ14_488 [Actinomycetota bacterium]